jgi:uncharacterized protein (DUF486 family)
MGYIGIYLMICLSVSVVFFIAGMPQAMLTYDTGVSTVNGTSGMLTYGRVLNPVDIIIDVFSQFIGMLIRNPALMAALGIAVGIAVVASSVSAPAGEALSTILKAVLLWTFMQIFIVPIYVIFSSGVIPAPFDWLFVMFMNILCILGVLDFVNGGQT